MTRDNLGRWLIWLTVMLLIHKIYGWCIHYSDIQKAVRIEQLEHDRIRKSWIYMYRNGSKETRRQMEKAYGKSGDGK